MEAVEEVPAWKVKDLRDWLDRASIAYSKTAKKQELIDLVAEAGKQGAVIERVASESDVSKLTIDGLIQWLSERNVDLPATRQKKQFYVDKAEEISQSLQDESPRSTTPKAERVKQTPSTTPRPSRSSVRKTPLRTKSSSPVRRRSARRKLLDMPDAYSSNEEEETADTQAEASPASALNHAGTGRTGLGAYVVLFVIFSVISAYIAYLAQSLISHFNW